MQLLWLLFAGFPRLAGVNFMGTEKGTCPVLERFCIGSLSMRQLHLWQQPCRMGMACRGSLGEHWGSPASNLQCVWGKQL